MGRKGRTWRRVRYHVAPHRVVWRLLFGHNPPTARQVRRHVAAKATGWATPRTEAHITRTSKGLKVQSTPTVNRVGRLGGIRTAAERRRAQEEANVARVVASSVRRDQAAAKKAAPMQERVKRTNDGRFNGSTKTPGPQPVKVVQVKAPTMRDANATLHSAARVLKSAERRAERDLGWGDGR